MNEENKNRGETIETRLNRIEDSFQKQKDTVDRLRYLIDGNSDYQITGVLKKLADYIESDAGWKRDTERRIQEAEKRIALLEDEKLGRKIVLEQSQAVLYAIIIILFVAVVWLASSYFQNSGGGKVALPIMPFLLSIEPRIIQGFLWKFSTSY